MGCGLRKWLIKDTENCLLAKFAVLYKTAKCVQGYDTAQSRFCTQYQKDQAENIVHKGRKMYATHHFSAEIDGVSELTDKVAKVF